MQRLIIFVSLVSILRLVSGCGTGMILLPDEGGTIQPGYYTGIVTSTLIIKTNGKTTQNTTEDAPYAIQINEDGTIFSEGKQINVGDQETAYFGEYPILVTVSSIVRDENTLTITFSLSGQWTISNDVLTISGHSTNTFQSNVDGGLNASGYIRGFASGDDIMIDETVTSTGVLSK